MSNTVILVILFAIVFLTLSVIITLFVIIYQRRQLNFKNTTEQLKATFNHELLQTQLEIQEQTFLHISQEIHDNIGQALSFIKLNINMINIDERDNANYKLNESKRLLTKAIQDLRDLSKTLNTDFINETGLSNAIEQQLNILRKSGIYSTELTVSGEREKYSVQTELVVFRIIQELLNNIVKHAEADTIKILMDYQPEKLSVLVNDNGKGYNTKENAWGLGQRNIQNRIRLIYGSVSIESLAGKGTTVKVELPLQKELQNEKI